VVGPQAADLLSAALAACPLPDDDPRYVRALGGLGRALAFAGETARARLVGGRAIELARQLGDDATLAHALTASLWHGTSPDMAELQLERTREVFELAQRWRDYGPTLGSATNFRAMAAYLRGLPHELEEAIDRSAEAARVTGEPYYRYVAACLAQAVAFMRGDFVGAQRWADESLKENLPFGDNMAEGPHGVQMFMIRRELGGLDEFRRFLDGTERFEGRWVPALLALYTELGIERGIRRALDHLLDRDTTSHTDEAQWPMQLCFMIEGALALDDVDAVRLLRPLLDDYAGLNLFGGTLIAVFGSSDRLLGRITALLGDHGAAERHFTAAVEMDRHMRSPVHLSESLTHFALFAAAHGRTEQANRLAGEAREIAAGIGQQRTLRALDALTPPAGPDGLSDREVEVLRLLATGLSNQEIGARLHISANTAANHVRRILMKTGTANRTQAALYAAQHQLV
jgi:DNA-binding CsgD family transcriptional regulator